MTISDMFKTLGASIAITGIAVTSALAAGNTDHDTLPACYASVQQQCYGDNQENCTSEEYNDGLDECDSSYGGTQSRPVSRPKFLGANTLKKTR